MRFSSSQSADEAIIITDKKGKVLFAYDPDKDEAMGKNSRTYSGAVLSSPNLKVGDTVRIYVGGDVDGEELNGVYDVSTVKDFEGASRQCYTGNSVGGFGGGGFGGGGFGGGFGGERPDFSGETPEGFEGGFGGNFGGGAKPEKPSGNMPDFGGEMPDFGGELPEGFEENFGGNFGGGNRPEGDFFGGGSTTATCTATKEFELSEIVNAFSGVSDIRHSPVEQNGVTVCSVCGITVTDDDSLTETESDSDGNNTLIYILVALGSAAVTSGITLAVIFIIRKKKSAPETTEE